MGPEHVRLRLEDAIAAAELLEQVTVSLDRIGSREADGFDPGSMLSAFLHAADISRRCSWARQPLWDAIDDLKGHGTSEQLADAIPVYPEVGGEATTRFPWRDTQLDSGDLPGTFVVEVGIRQSWPFVGFCDNRFAESLELRLYLNTTWRLGEIRSDDVPATQWLTIADRINGLTVDTASVDAHGSLRLGFHDGPSLTLAEQARPTGEEAWWLSST